jgi:uncharacterized repeat protein (TIGR03803 family)
MTTLDADAAPALGAVETLFTFPVPMGAWPQSGLMQADDGNFYATTTVGGRYGGGGIIRVTPEGKGKMMAAFGNGNGALEGGALLQGADGALYGTTQDPWGRVFRLTLDGTYTVLHRFDQAVWQMVQAHDGNFYGMTASGGGGGTIFRMTPQGEVTTLAVLGYDLASFLAHAPLTEGLDGNLYASCHYGLYRISLLGEVSRLVDFDETTGIPTYLPTRVTIDSTGTLFGVTAQGGPHNWGTFFKVTTNGLLTVLHAFETPGPVSLTLAPDGNFYGSTPAGGPSAGIIRLTPDGAEHLLTSDAASELPLLESRTGELIGIAGYGGAAGFGRVYRVGLDGQVTTFFSFPGRYGGHPGNSLIAAGGGKLIGTTSQGGADGGFGTIFRVSPSGKMRNLESSDLSDGGVPVALTRAPDGRIYGVTRGSASGPGTVFILSKSGARQTLAHFSKEQGDPTGLMTGTDGSLYGTTSTGWSGVIFKLEADGQPVTLAQFAETITGRQPNPEMAQGPDGTLYGTSTYGGPKFGGTIFKLTPDGTLSTVVAFDRSPPAFRNPYAGLVRGGDGFFYGTTTFGGPGDCGAAFKLSGDGVMTTLAPFAGDFCFPQTTLVAGDDGFFYGATDSSVFRLGTDGSLRKVAPAPVGHMSSFLNTSDGALYGTTSDGGQQMGTVVRMLPPPAQLHATGGVQQILIGWKAQPAALEHRIYLGTAPGAEGDSPVAALLQADGAQISGLSGGTYYLKVSAVDAAGESWATDEVTVTVSDPAMR